MVLYWSSLIKKFMQMYIVIVSGSILKRFHCLFEWHLTSHMTLSIETCFRWTSCTAFPNFVHLIQVSLYLHCIFSRGFCSDNNIMLLTLSHVFFFFYEQSTLEKKAGRERCMKNRLRLGQFVPVR